MEEKDKPKRIYELMKGDDWAGLLLRRMYKYDKNNIIAIVGEVGSGKSFTALKIAELLCPHRFNVDNVFHKPAEFTEYLSPEKQKEIQQGDVLIFDEAGVSYDSKNWYSNLNKILSYTLQTFRNRNITLILTVPDLRMIDSTGRRLIKFLFIMDSIDYKRKLTIVKPYILEYNLLLDRTYRKYFELKSEPTTIDKWLLGLPSQKIIGDYLKKKEAWQQELYKSIHRSVQSYDVLMRKIPTKEDITIYNKWKDGKKQTELAEEFGTNQRAISRVVGNVKTHLGK